MLKLSTHSGFHDLFLKYIHGLESFWIGFMVFNTTFKNISVISWRSVLLVKETWENHRQLSLTTFITYCCIEYTSPCGDCYRYLWLSVLFVLPKDKELGNRKQDKLQRQQIQIPFSTSIHWCHFPNHFDKLGNSSVQKSWKWNDFWIRNKALYIEKCVRHQFNTMANKYNGTIYDRHDDFIFPIVNFAFKEVIGCRHAPTAYAKYIYRLINILIIAYHDLSNISSRSSCRYKATLEWACLYTF